MQQYLAKLSKVISRDDLQVIELKYAEKRIDQMDNPELLTKAAECLFRIHVITGWSLPDDKSYIKVLTEELMLKLKEDFFMMNFAEITAAMRKAVGKQDWGKNMNLELISGVLAAYCSERSRISTEEEKVSAKQPEQVVLTPEELDRKIDDQRRGELEEAYQAIRKGYNPLIFDYYEPLLRKDGIITGKENTEELITYLLFIDAGNIYLKT